MSRGLARGTALFRGRRLMVSLVDPPVPPAPRILADASASSAGLLIDHTRALVTAEETRVAALQAQATALLTAIGVLVTVAGAVGVLFAGRQFNPASGAPRVASIGLAIVSLLTLLVGATLAIAVLGRLPEPAQPELLDVVEHQFPNMIDDATNPTTRTLLTLLLGELRTRQNISETIAYRLLWVRRSLGAGVVAGVLAVVILITDTSPGTVETHLANSTVTVVSRTTP